MQVEAYGRIQSMAVDWIARNLYWIDSTVKGIQIVSMDTKFRSTLVMENMTTVTSMAIDPREGFVD